MAEHDLARPQRLHERPQKFFIGLPAADGGGMDGLAHLPVGGRAYGALGLVKGQAGVVPFEPEEIDDAPAFLLEAADEGLVAHVENGEGQDLAPVVHQHLIGPVVKPEIAQVRSPGAGAGEIREIA